MDCRICGSGTEWVGEMKAVSLWIAPQLPDLERDKATAWRFILRPGHLNLNLSLEDKWIKSPSFPCSKEFTCSKADEQQLLFSRGGTVTKRRPNQTCRRGLWALGPLLCGTGTHLTFLCLFCATWLIILVIPLPRCLNVSVTIKWVSHTMRIFSLWYNGTAITKHSLSQSISIQVHTYTSGVYWGD